MRIAGLGEPPVSELSVRAEGAAARLGLTPMVAWRCRRGEAPVPDPGPVGEQVDRPVGVLQEVGCCSRPYETAT